MGWEKQSQPAEVSDGETEKVSDAWTNVKTDDAGNVTDIAVGKPGSEEH